MLGDGAVRTELLADAQERDIWSFVEPGQTRFTCRILPRCALMRWPRGKTSSSNTFVLCSLAWSLSITAVTPSIISSAVLRPSPELLCDHHHGDLGADVFYVSLSSRHRTCWVRSPLMPRLALRLAKCWPRPPCRRSPVADGVADEDQVDVPRPRAC